MGKTATRYNRHFDEPWILAFAGMTAISEEAYLGEIHDGGLEMAIKHPDGSFNSGIGVFYRHARGGGYPGLLARHFLDSAKASPRVLPPAQRHTGAGTQS